MIPPVKMRNDNLVRIYSYYTCTHGMAWFCVKHNIWEKCYSKTYPCLSKGRSVSILMPGGAMSFKFKLKPSDFLFRPWSELLDAISFPSPEIIHVDYLFILFFLNSTSTERPWCYNFWTLNHSDDPPMTGIWLWKSTIMHWVMKKLFALNFHVSVTSNLHFFKFYFS